MTAATLIKDEETFGWQPHVHVDKFRASAERDTLFSLFPERAREAERAGLIGTRRDGGGLLVDPRATLVPVTAADLLRPDDEVLGGGLVLPRITGELMALVTDPYDVADELGNLLVNAGINKMGGWLIVDSGTHYNAANTAIGVGDTSTAAAASQTDLSAAVNAANRWVQLVDAIPTFASQVFTAVATFATGNGNFAWAEWAIGQNTASAAAAITASMLNRKVAALGTKTSAAAWAFTVTITIS